MTKRTEMQELKGLLFWAAKNSPRLTAVDVNAMIADANRAAFDALDDKDKRNIRQLMDILQANVKGKFGDGSALEVLSAVAQVMEAPDAP